MNVVFLIVRIIRCLLTKDIRLLFILLHACSLSRKDRQRFLFSGAIFFAYLLSPLSLTIFPSLILINFSTFLLPNFGAVLEDSCSRFYHTLANPIVVQEYTLINIFYFPLLLVFFFLNVSWLFQNFTPWYQSYSCLFVVENELLFSVNLPNIPQTPGKKNSPKHGKKVIKCMNFKACVLKSACVGAHFGFFTVCFKNQR